MSHFFVGQTITVDGISFRVVEGRKVRGDLRLEWFGSERQWLPMSMKPGFLFADFFHENEDRRFHGVNGYEGGNYYTRRCWTAIHDGWWTAAALLDQEREQRNHREAQAEL